MNVERMKYEGRYSGALTAKSEIPAETLSYYRQPGGCIEASMWDDVEQDADIFHFCEIADARQFIAEFTQFVDAAEATPDAEALSEEQA